MNRPALISVFSDQRRTKSTTRSRTSCGTHTLVRAPQDFFLRPCAQPSIRPAPHPSSGSSFPGTRSVVVRLGGPDGSWTGRQPPRSRRTLFANGRTPLAAAPVPHTDRKPALYPANAVLGCQPSLRQCSASALFACVLSVILTEERSLQFQLRQDILGEDFRSLVVCGMTSEAGGYTVVVGVFGMRWFLLAGGGIMGRCRWRGKVRRFKVLRPWRAPRDPGRWRAGGPFGWPGPRFCAGG